MDNPAIIVHIGFFRMKYGKIFIISLYTAIDGKHRGFYRNCIRIEMVILEPCPIIGLKKAVEF
jgi:hypothetical protein